MKVRADEHVSEEIVRVVSAMALSLNWELTSVLSVGDRGKTDIHWATKFAREGGQVILTADTDFFKHHHLVVAVYDAGLQIVHMPPKWSNAAGHLQAAHMLLWWRRIETACESRKSRCWRPPWNLSEDGEISPVKVDYESHRKKARRAERPSRKGNHRDP